MKESTPFSEQDLEGPVTASQPAIAPQAQPSWASKGIKSGLLLLLVFAMIRSCIPKQVETQSPQVRQQREQATPKAEPTSQPIQVDQAKVKRNALLGVALERSQQIAEDSMCARKEYFLLDAQKQLQGKGVPIEQTLLSKLQEVNSNNQQATVARANFDGGPESTAIARPLNADSQALLLALQQYYEGQPLTLCNVAPAASILAIQQFTDQANLVQQSDAQSRLEIQVKEQENESPIP